MIFFSVNVTKMLDHLKVTEELDAGKTVEELVKQDIH